MNTITIKAYAKINLSIDVLRKREDGYHDVRMVMQQIDLSDTVSVSVAEKWSGIELTINRVDLPTDDSNIAVKAAKALLQTEAGLAGAEGYGIRIEIEKNIPVAAGLAGGSADAAAVLHALNRLFELGFSLRELMEVGVKVGADVPFCLMGQAALNPVLGFCTGKRERHTEQDGRAQKNIEQDGRDQANVEPGDYISACAEATGIGEILAPLPAFRGWVCLSKPPIEVSTKEIYGALKVDEIAEHPDTDGLIADLSSGDYASMYKKMGNVLEKISELQYPVIMYTKNMMDLAKAEGNSESVQTTAISDPDDLRIMMSGSGPTVFAIASEYDRLLPIFERLKLENEETYLVKSEG